MNQSFFSNLFLLLLPILGFGQDYHFNIRQVKIEDGISGRRIRTVEKDNEGYIWLGTGEGLKRFNGHGFEHFTKESHGLSSNRISQLHLDDEGDIWITFDEDKYSNFRPMILKPKTLEFISVKEKMGKYYKEEYDKLKLGKRKLHPNISFSLPLSTSYYLYLPSKGIEMLPRKQVSTYNSRTKEYWYFDETSNEFIKEDSLRNVMSKVSCPVNKVFKIEGISKNYICFPATDSGKNYLFYKHEKDSDFLKFEILNFGSAYVGSDGFYLNGRVYFDHEGKLIDYEIGELNIQRIKGIFKDKRNNVIVATNSELYFISLQENLFKSYLQGKGKNDQIFSSRGLWANDTYLYALSKFKDYRVNFYSEEVEQILEKQFSSNKAFAVCQSEDGNLWVGGINNPLLKIDPVTKEVLYQTPTFKSKTWYILEDRNGRLWLGQNQYGLLYFDPDKMEVPMTYQKLNGYDELKTSDIIHIVEDKRDYNYLWLATQSGLYLHHIEEGIKARFSTQSPVDFQLPTSNFNYTYQDNDGVFWLGSAYEGVIKVVLYDDYRIQSYESFTTFDGLSSNVVNGIFEDDYNRLWLSTNNGINSFDKKKQLVYTYLEKDGLPTYEFNRTSNFQRPDGTIFFGSIDGVVSFHPKNFNKINTLDIPLVISKAEKYSTKAEEFKNVTNDILRKNKIVISPDERFLTLWVTLQDYAQSTSNRYLYKIEGLQKEFNVLSSNVITLNGLPYGNFRLKVKAQGANGRFSSQMIDFPLIVQKPYYLHWWFILLMILSVTLLIVQFFKMRTQGISNRKKELESIVEARTAQLNAQAKQLEVDKTTIEKQANELRSLDKMKSRFFANISHELRTPLTLILSPVQSILKRQKTDDRDFTSAKIIEQNAQNLLKRINEILDLTKLEAEEMNLQPRSILFYNFNKRLVSIFESLAGQKQQKMTFDFQLDKELTLALDPDKYEHIFNNYISNAIKFTPKNGIIRVRLTDKQFKTDNGNIENRIVLSISDNGQGIPKAELPKVFDRFYQSEVNNKNAGGSGIGLALVKEIATLMGGKVSVESEFGKGSTFVFEMPYIEEIGILKEKVLDDRKVSPQSTFDLFEDYIDKLSNNRENHEPIHKPTILLVEDNLQLQNYIQIILQEKYLVISAENGKEALLELEALSSLKRQPHIIISDIMMPEMDGFELLETIKTNVKWRHLPMILLTARSNQKDKLKALRIGVDDYILKPFQEEELLVRIDNLIKNFSERTKNNQVQTSIENEQNPAAFRISETDMKWLEKVEKIVKAELSNSNFTIDTLALSLHASRSKVHRRIKLITGLTPNNYLKEIKLQTAREILERGDAYTVAEVCYKVGFDTPKYFSKIFEQRFGRRPISYIRSI